MLDNLTSHKFEPYLNETFHVRLSEAQKIDLQLTTINDLGYGEQDETARRAFALIFRGPMDLVLPQRIYRLEHDVLGELDIFLVPVGPDSAGMQYEAVFA